MGRTVLIIDGDESRRRELREILTDDYDVLEASQEQEALLTLHRNSTMISVALLGFNQPTQDGLSVLRKILDNAVWAQIPVVAVCPGEAGNGNRSGDGNTAGNGNAAGDGDRAGNGDRTGNGDAIGDGDRAGSARETALAQGAVTCISTPLNPSEIKSTVANIIRFREGAAMSNYIYKDKLTGIYNRDGFFNAAKMMIKSSPAGYYTLSCFDIDNFKLINDRYGTHVGDRVLKHVAQTIRQCSDIIEGICCRYMGDQFAALYPTKFKDSELISNNYLLTSSPDCISRPIRLRIGRYTVTDRSTPIGTMFDRAAMAGRSIKGRYDIYIAEYNDEMRSQIIREQQIIDDMAAALAGGQFEPWFQPQFNHTTRALIGAEALVRWNHPAKGLISPGEFIPVFERNGFIYEMDKYVWEQVCILLRRWIDAGSQPLPVSVNISRADIFAPDFFDYLIGLVLNYNIPIELLRLEITESAFSESPEQIIEAVTRLVDFGFTVEIDDFGSGYSSLNTLKDVPAQIIKLDMRFLDSKKKNKRSGTILESVVRMAKWLNMTVIAEGVEDKPQADYLQSIGCQYIQGFLYGNPLPAAEYERLVKKSAVENVQPRLETLDSYNNETFWDPESLDTLVFNHFSGGAFIFELHGDKYELLRVNSEFAKTFNSSLSIDEILKIEPFTTLDGQSRKKVEDAVESARTNDRAATCEVFTRQYTDSCNGEYIRMTVRKIAAANGRELFYAYIDNTTEIKSSQAHERKISSQLQSIMDNVESGVSAAVFEGGTLKYIFANDRYYSMFGYTKQEFIASCPNGLIDIVLPEDSGIYTENVSPEGNIGDTKVFEYRVLCRNGNIIWVRSTITICYIEGEELPVHLAASADITHQVQINNQLVFLNETAHKILAHSDADTGINAMLLRLLDYFEGNRAYIFELDFEDKMTDNTYEVCADGVTSEMASLQRVPFVIVASWLEAFNSHDFIAIGDVDSLSDESPEKSILQRQRIKSLIAVPLRRNGELIGLIGVDDAKKNHRDVGRIAALGDYISVLLIRRDYERKIEERNTELAQMMQDMPGGFAKMRIEGNHIYPVFLNDEFCRLSGMTTEQAMMLYASDAYSGIYPDDEKPVKEIIGRAIAEKTTVSLRVRLRTGNGDFIPMQVFYRVTTDSNGSVWLNGYYTDATAAVSAEQLRIDLLDNLPEGAALYEYDGESLKIVHLNHRYWELVGRKPDKDTPTSFLSAVYPGDMPFILREINDAISENRDFCRDFRIIHGDGNYRPFHVVGRIADHGAGKYLLYATYSPISTETMSYRELLPVVLSAIMTSSPDLTFAKDMDLRYICASRAFAKMAGFESENDIISKTDFEIFSEKIAEKYRHDDEALIASGKPLVDMIEEIPSADETPRFANTSKYPLLDGNGVIRGIYGVSRDVTAARDAFEKLELITDNIPGGVVTFSVSNGTGTLTYFNDGFCELMGVSREYCNQNGCYKLMEKLLAGNIPHITEQVITLIRDGNPIDGVLRIAFDDGTVKWVSYKAAVGEKYGDVTKITALILDVTQQYRATEKLRISEEEYRLAMQQTGNVICRFSIKDRTLIMSPEVAQKRGLPETIKNMPQGMLELGKIAKENETAYADFFESIISGTKTGSLVFSSLLPEGWRWIEEHFSTVFGDNGKPDSAVISFSDVTEQIEKEAIVKKWQQSLQTRSPEAFSLYRCNISRRSTIDTKEGLLIDYHFDTDNLSFNENAREYAKQRVYEEDRDKYIDFVDSDIMIASYYRDKRYEYIEYREMLADGSVKWIRLTVELVEFPNSHDVAAYLMYEDINESKISELRLRGFVNTDPLTGVLNRHAFAEKTDKLIEGGRTKKQQALLLFDIDGFKFLNDTLGHDAGDKVLVDITEDASSILGDDDFIGRLGGDEFIVLLGDVKDNNQVADKAKQLCSIVRRTLTHEVHISASIGIALCPKDAVSFDSLYKKADLAMYSVKNLSRDSYAFYYEGIENARAENDSTFTKKKPHLLIITDSRQFRDTLSAVFLREYSVDSALTEKSALINLRHFGSAISAIIIDCTMSGANAAVLTENIHRDSEFQSIPIIAVNAPDDVEYCVNLFKFGATDFVTAPLDTKMLRVRLKSAIGKAENERLRVENRVIAMETSETIRYRSALENKGIAVVEYDWVNGVFSYDPAISKLIAGNFDSRKLWHILLSDMVADTQTVKKIQAAVYEIALDRSRSELSLSVELTVPTGEKLPFLLNIFKVANEYRMVNKLIMTFTRE